MVRRMPHQSYTVANCSSARLDRFGLAGRVETTRLTKRIVSPGGARRSLRSACGTFPTVVWPVQPHGTFTVEAETHWLSLPVINRCQMRLAKSRTTRCSNGT